MQYGLEGGKEEDKEKAEGKAAWLFFQSVSGLRADWLFMPLSHHPRKMDKKQFQFRFLFYVKYHSKK